MAVSLVAAMTRGPAALAQDPAGQSPTALDVAARGVKTFYASSRAGNNQVTVFSESSLEDFTSVCNRIGGQCTVDPQHVETLKGRFHLRVEDIDTGIDLRNRHLVSPDWLDAKEYPNVVIEIERVEDVERIRPNEVKLVMLASCTLHGVTRDVRIAGRLVYLDESPRTMQRVKGDLIRLRATFSVRLADFGITGPLASDTIGLKVAETVEVRATVFGSTEVPPDELEADAPKTTDETTRPAPVRSVPKRSKEDHPTE